MPTSLENFLSWLTGHFLAELVLATIVAAVGLYMLNKAWDTVVWFFSKQEPDALTYLRYTAQLWLQQELLLPDQLRGTSFMLTEDDLLPRPSPAMQCWTFILGLVRAGASLTGRLVAALTQWFWDWVLKLLLGSSS